MENRIVINRKTPKSHDKYVATYLELNPSAKKPNDGMDVSAVKTKNGISGYALLPEEMNRSRDRDPHRGVNFISSEELRKAMK